MQQVGEPALALIAVGQQPRRDALIVQDGVEHREQSLLLPDQLPAREALGLLLEADVVGKQPVEVLDLVSEAARRDRCPQGRR